MQRCEHGVYAPDGDGTKSEGCSLCTQRPLPVDQVPGEPFEPFPHGNRTCPQCGSHAIMFDGNNGFDCVSCGLSI